MLRVLTKVGPILLHGCQEIAWTCFVAPASTTVICTALLVLGIEPTRINRILGDLKAPALDCTERVVAHRHGNASLLFLCGYLSCI